MTMRLGLDARLLMTDQPRGVAKSTLRLYQHLADTRPGWQVIAYHDHAGPLPVDLPRTFQPQRLSIDSAVGDAWTQVRLPAAVRAERLDALHCPATACPRWMPVPTVVTIHDLTPLDAPQGHSHHALHRFEQAVHDAARKAAAVASPTRFVRDRLVESHGMNPKRGVVIPWGPTLCDEQVDISQAEKITASLGIDRGFLLHFGSAEERKDTRGVIAAWAMVRKRYRQNWRLLIVGLDKQSREEFGSLAAMLGVADETRLCGFVPERQLPVLMSCASVLVYPSTAEGFGLPVLEAFASATPVITSDTSSLPEVAGDAASLVPPGRPTALATAMTALMKDPMRRAELAGRGTKRLGQFSWERAADHFARVCEAITKPRRRRKHAA